MDPTRRNAAIVLGVLAVGGIIWYSQTGHGKSQACALTTAALGVVVADVTHGKGTQEIVGTTAAGIVVPASCTAMIDKLVKSPTDTVKFKVNKPTGGSTQVETTGATVLSPPPATVPQSSGAIHVNLATALKCLDWEDNILTQLCWDGTFPPPAGS